MVYRGGNPMRSARIIYYVAEADILNSEPFRKFLVFRAQFLDGILFFDLGKELGEAI